MSGIFFQVFLFILKHISLDLLSLDFKKHTLGELGNWTVIWWRVVSRIFAPKIIKIW